MNTEINSKHGVVNVPPAEMYMRFVDMRNFTGNVPADVKVELTADYDTLHAVVQGFDIGVKVVGRQPYSRVDVASDNAPFQFEAAFNFQPVDGEPGKTEFFVDVKAELNMMMKMMLKSRIKEALDKLVDGLAGAAV